MGVYGDQLMFFNEQFRSFKYFSMSPEAVASYSDRKDLGTVTGIFQFMKRGELKRENETLADADVPCVWTRQTLSVGNYFIEIDDIIYRIKDRWGWKFEGNFNVYELETLVGNTDKQKEHEYVNLGQDNYD